MTRFRAIVVGCGATTHSWLPALCRRQDLEIVAAVDAVAERASALVAEYALACPTFASAERALAELDANLLINLTPPSMHRTIVGMGIEAGCDVFGEKPLAETLAEGQELVDLCRRTGRTYAVMQQSRFLPHARELREGIADGRIGTPTAVYADFFLWHPAPANSYLRRMEHALLVDLAIHQVDMARFVIGADATSVYCHEFNPEGSPYTAGAGAICTFELSNGAVFSYRGCWATKGVETSWGASWRITGTRGTVLWDGDGPPVADLGNGPEEWAWITEPETWKEACIDATLDALAAGRTPPTDAEDNIKSLAMVTTAVESARAGRRVTIDAG